MDRSEIKRLRKAAMSNNKLELGIWASRFEEQVRGDLDRYYKQKFENDLVDMIDVLLVAIAYTLHFSEEIRLGRKRLPAFMEDLMVTIDMFRTGEYSPQEYRDELEKNGIAFDNYQYEKLANRAQELFSKKKVPLEELAKEIEGKHKLEEEDNEA